MYQFGPFKTELNEYTREAHCDLRKQAASAGWTRIDLTLLGTRSCDFVRRVQLSDWCGKNNIVPMNISHYNEFWFEREEDAVLFKMVWGHD